MTSCCAGVRTLRSRGHATGPADVVRPLLARVERPQRHVAESEPETRVREQLQGSKPRRFLELGAAENIFAVAFGELVSTELHQTNDDLEPELDDRV